MTSGRSFPCGLHFASLCDDRPVRDDEHQPAGDVSLAILVLLAVFLAVLFWTGYRITMESHNEGPKGSGAATN